eukprot:s2250_g4.t1
MWHQRLQLPKVESHVAWHAAPPAAPTEQGDPCDWRQETAQGSWLMQSSLAIQEQSQPFAERCIMVVLLVFVKPRRPGAAAARAASVTALKHKRENMALRVGWWEGISEQIERPCLWATECDHGRAARSMLTMMGITPGGF